MIDTLLILHINDSHSRIFPFGPWVNNERYYPSVIRLAYIVDSLRNLYPKNLFFHAGDFLSGDFPFNASVGRYDIKILKTLRVDAIALGNHEFDAGPDSLYNALSSENIYLLSANMDTTSHLLKTRIKPYEIFNINSKKICVLGLTTTEFNTINPYQQPIKFKDPLPIAQAYQDTFNNLNCNLKILLTHLGDYVDSNLAKQTKYNLIIGGHSHTKIDTLWKFLNANNETTYVVQAYEHFKVLGKILWDLTNNKPISYELIDVLNSPNISQYMVDTLNNIKSQIYAKFGNVYEDSVITLDSIITAWPDSAGCLDIPTGNLIADAMRYLTNSALAVIETDALVYPLYKGKITSDDVFQVMPYGFDYLNAYNSRIYKITIKGIDMYNILGFAQYIRGDKPIVQVSGFTYQFTPSVPMEVSDISIDTGQIYVVAGSVYTLYVSSLLSQNIISVETTNSNVFHALKSYLQILQNPIYHSECRVKYKQTSISETKPKLKYKIVKNVLIWKDERMGKIYRIDGRKVYDLRKDGSYYLRSGIYIVKAGREKVKIVIP
ncbi:MAG: metallophosphoesterase [candidate division WOR-3 bacterium]